MDKLIQDLFNAFNVWFQGFGSEGKPWDAIALNELWGSLLKGISDIFATA
ncbi:MAG: hypothetical protein LBN05_03185 [Oscillospiraceae bacterium]|jgi:hypothetical protein|nr:hypothetical protein [Oscillospiraceae bacterium]